MNLRILTQIFTLRDFRNALMGMFVVVGGLGLAFFTLWAHRSGQPQMAGIAAGASLVFVLLILVFVVPPLARSASAEASQLNLPFELTLGGAVMLGLLVVVGFSAWNTGNNILFLVLSILTASLGVGFAVGGACLKKIDVRMRFPETIFAGEPTPIVVSLHNRKWLLPTFSVIVEVRGRDRERSALAAEVSGLIPARLAERILRPPIVKHTLDYFVYVPRRGEVENRAEHVFSQRGRFVIRDFELSTRFPFGFFRHRRRLSAQEAEIVIFPALAPFDQDANDLPLEAGNLLANRRGAGQDLLALRDYQPRDDLRRVDWKATARSSGLIVKEFAAEDDRRVTLVFDSRLLLARDARGRSLRQRIDDERKGMNVYPEAARFEAAVSRAAALLSFFSEEQAEIRLVVGEETDDFGLGREHLAACFRRLATVEPEFAESYDGAVFEQRVRELSDDSREGYVFLMTALDASGFTPEFISRVKLLRY